MVIKYLRVAKWLAMDTTLIGVLVVCQGSKHSLRYLYRT